MDDLEREAVSRIRIYLRSEGLILPKAPIKEFYSHIFKLSGFGIGGLLNLSGKKAGNMAAHILREVFESEEEDLEAVFRYIKVFLGETGICDVEDVVLEEDKIRLSVKGSIFAEAVGSSKKPVCIPLSGALEGLLEELTGERWKSKEVECTAQGKERCVFEITR